MKINILECKKNELEIELAGEGHTFCNAVQSALLKDETVEFSGYNIQHPLTSQPVFFIRTKGERNPLEALIDAGRKLKQELCEIEESFKEAWKNERDKSYRESKD
ncbi:MAG: DNA-directed RNA polymerase subunit L [Candidatus Bathyarchaeia archaeon]